MYNLSYFFFTQVFNAPKTDSMLSLISVENLSQDKT